MNNLPIQFTISSIEQIKYGSTVFELPKCSVLFEKWDGANPKESFGGKPFIKMNGKPMFVELAIAKIFIEHGWNARWVETYGRVKQIPVYLTDWKDTVYQNQINVPINDARIEQILHHVSIQNNGTYAGCWDGLAWKDNDIVFMEAKRKGKDKMRNSQYNWLAAAIKNGLSEKQFLIVEWDFMDIKM